MIVTSYKYKLVSYNNKIIFLKILCKERGVNINTKYLQIPSSTPQASISSIFSSTFRNNSASLLSDKV